MPALPHWWALSYEVLSVYIYVKSLVVLLKVRLLHRFFFPVYNKISGSLWQNTLQLQNWQQLLFALYWKVRSSLSLLSVNGVYSWFSEGKEFLTACIAQDCITFHIPCPNCIVCTPPPPASPQSFLRVGGVGGWSSYQIFKKRVRDWQDLHF